MEMTKDALQLLQTTAQQAANAQVLSISGDPDRLLISQGGTREIIDLPPKHRNHAVSDIDSLLALADRYPETAVLWHSEEAVVLVFDDQIRRDIATLKLEFSKVYATLRSFANGKKFEQAQLVRLLKITFADCVPPELLDKVRTVKFNRHESGESTVNHGQASMGRKIEAAVTGADQIPESFVVQTKVYSNVMQDQTETIRVSIDPDLEEHNFELSIVGDDLTTSMLITQETLAGRLAEGNDQRRILFGKP